MEGHKFGRLYINTYLGNNMYACQCVCGNTIRVKGYNIRSGNTRSCGCLRREVSRSTVTSRCKTHGKSRTPEYRSWSNMLRRCYDSRCDQYSNYGGRGISVCERWRHNFQNFLNDLGERPANTSLDRIDVNGQYELSNCRWASINTQAINKRKHIVTAARLQELLDKEQQLSALLKKIEQ